MFFSSTEYLNETSLAVEIAKSLCGYQDSGDVHIFDKICPSKFLQQSSLESGKLCNILILILQTFYNFRNILKAGQLQDKIACQLTSKSWIGQLAISPWIKLF